MADLIAKATETLTRALEPKLRKLQPDAIFFWQDREVRFDVPIMLLGMRKGEIMIDVINGVEDTKGNNGVRGYLVITNLRIMWYNERKPKCNLTIGFDCITNISIKTTESKLRGNIQALHLRTKYKTQRYEFVYTSLIHNSPRLFTSFQAVVRSYETTKLYRDLKLRGAIIQDKELILLPHETIYNRY
jgi:Bardet-Biedl syndrome 5 protein